MDTYATANLGRVLSQALNQSGLLSQEDLILLMAWEMGLIWCGTIRSCEEPLPLGHGRTSTPPEPFMKLHHIEEVRKSVRYRDARSQRNTLIPNGSTGPNGFNVV